MACIPLTSIDSSDVCEESFGGLGSSAWIFVHDDLDPEHPLSLIEDEDGVETAVYQWEANTLKPGAYLYKVQLKPNSQGITGESNGSNKGFKQTGQFIIDTTNPNVSRFLRALNNRHGYWGIIVNDGQKYQVMYTKGEALTLDAGALKTETGNASSDDRQTTLAPVLDKALFPETYIEFPKTEGKTGSPDDYLKKG